MNGLIAGRTASTMPGLDIAEQKSWQNYLTASLRVYAALNRRLTDDHQLSLADVRLLNILGNSPNGSSRMGDLVEALPSLPGRITRQIRRLESQGLVRRATSPGDRRGVVATITDEGRTLAEQAMMTYARNVRIHFLNQLSRPQIAAVGENSRQIGTAIKRSKRW